MDAQVSRTREPGAPLARASRAVVGAVRTMWTRDPWRIAGLPLVLLILVVYFSLKSPYFLTGPNFRNLALNMSTVGILAVGQAFVIVLAEIDISVGAILGLTSVTTAIAVRDFGAIGILAAPLTGIAAGLINGGVISRFAVHSVIVTIGTMTAFRGLAFAITNGTPVVITFPGFVNWLGNGEVGPLPAPFVVMLVVFAVGFVVFRLMTFGPKLYATGGNEEAARQAGINVQRVKLLAFVASGLLASIAGLVFAGRISSGQPTLGQNLELQAIAAAVVGGMALTGGRGTIGGVLLGVVILAVLQNGLDISNVNSFWQQFISGVVIVVAVVIDRIRDIGPRSLFGWRRRPRRSTRTGDVKEAR